MRYQPTLPNYHKRSQRSQRSQTAKGARKKRLTKLKASFDENYGASSKNRSGRHFQIDNQVVLMTKRLANLSGIKDEELQSITSFNASYQLNNSSHSVYRLKEVVANMSWSKMTKMNKLLPSMNDNIFIIK